MKLFRLVGILPPGRVVIHKRGEITLVDINDDLAEILWRDGLPYLEPTELGRKKLFPNEKPIEVQKIKVEGGKIKTKRSSTP